MNLDTSERGSWLAADLSLDPALSSWTDPTATTVCQSDFAFGEGLANDSFFQPDRESFYTPAQPQSDPSPQRWPTSTSDSDLVSQGFAECPGSRSSREQHRALLETAMPGHKLQGTERSPTSAVTSPIASVPEPEPSHETRSMKRKSSAVTRDDEAESPSESNPVISSAKKRGHNVCEKRYRAKLNLQITELREHIPSLRNTRPDGSVYVGAQVLEPGQDSSLKCGKGGVLVKAIEYISHLEEANERLVKDDSALKTRVVAFEKLALAGCLSPNKIVCCMHGSACAGC